MIAKGQRDVLFVGCVRHGANLGPARYVRRIATIDPASFDAAVDAFFDRWFAFNPTTAAGAGLHEYDPRLGPRDAAAVAAYISDLAALERRFEAFDPAALTADQRLDRELVLREIRGDRFWLEEVASWRHNPSWYASQMDMTLLLLLDYAPLAERMASIVGRLEQFPDLVAAARQNVQDPPRPFVETALIVYGGWPAFLEQDLTDALAPVADEALQARFRAARDRAVAALREYAEHLRRDVLPTADGEYALGAERFHRMNALLAGVDIPTAELKRVGQAELARLQILGDSLAARIAPDAPPGERGLLARAALGADHPSADQIVPSAGGVIDDLRAFVSQSGFGTVLPGEVEVRESPPFARTNFAYIWIPGPFETSATTGFYFIQPAEPIWSEAVTREFLEHNNDWLILNVGGHEAYPGHYHHFNHLKRAPTKTQQLLTAYVTTEGWAHYVEEKAWREGLADGDPRLGLAVVQDALLRAVRYLVAIGLHTDGLTVGEAESMFRTLAWQDSVNARQQALRGTYDPEFLNYTLGKLMIGRLLEDSRAAAARAGRAFELRAFHDAFMAHGAPPVPWIGRRMLEDPTWAPFGTAAPVERQGAARPGARAAPTGSRR